MDIISLVADRLIMNNNGADSTFYSIKRLTIRNKLLWQNLLMHTSKIETFHATQIKGVRKQNKTKMDALLDAPL